MEDNTLFLAGLLWTRLPLRLKTATTWRKLWMGCLSLAHKVQDDDFLSPLGLISLWEKGLKGPGAPHFSCMLFQDLERFLLTVLDFQLFISRDTYKAFLETLQMQLEDRTKDC